MFKAKENYGFNFLRYLLTLYYSEYDCYGNRDLLSGILYFGINNNVPVHWKLCLELAITKLYKNRSLAMEVADQFAKEVITLFPKQLRGQILDMWLR